MYNELFEAWKKEKETPDLQQLPKDFYARLADYMRRIREERRMMDEESIRGKLLRKEEENVRKMITDLIRTRYEKISQIIAKREIAPLTALTEEEESLYNGLSSHVEAYNALLKDILQGQKPKIRLVKTRGFMVVRILKEIPQIVGSDMKTYGPFKPEDVASLPEENAKALIKQGAAVEVEIQ
ncbi:DNA replication complex GINS family protein [Candidatus Bathyarchaeota archaeon]|nr:DNA replication complex GINS family protein [Candidatus Bathyarchaeota archaeon]